MAKVTIDANELHGTDVKRVSLVKRAASRLPFRIVKSDEDAEMLDLSKLFLKKGDAPARASVYAIMVRKGADLTKVSALLKSAGFTLPEKATEAGNATVFMLKGDDEPANDSVLLKSSDDIGFVVENLAKGFDGFDFRAADFLADTFKKGEFMPSPNFATVMFNDFVTKGLKKAEGGTTAFVKSAETYKTYVDRLNAALPAELLKADARPSTDAGSTDIKDAIDPGTVDKTLAGGTSTAATADDDKAVNGNKNVKSVSGGKLDVLAKGMDRWDSMTDPDGDGDDDAEEHRASGGSPQDWSAMGHEGRLKWALANKDKMAKDAAKAAAKEAAKKGDEGERAKLLKWADDAAAKGDFLAAAKLTKLAKAGGFPADTMDNEGDDNASKRKLTDKANNSGAGASGTDCDANVKKRETARDALLKSAAEFEAAGLPAYAKTLKADAERVMKDNANGGVSATEDFQPSNMSADNGSSQNATDDDASNTAVNAGKGKKDPNLAANDKGGNTNGKDLTNEKNGNTSDSSGWTQKVAGEILAVVSKQMGDALGEVKKSMAALGEQVAAVAERAKKTEDAVSGTVFSEPGRDMTGAHPFFKSEERRDVGIPLLDTSIRKWDEDVNVSDIRNFARARRA